MDRTYNKRKGVKIMTDIQNENVEVGVEESAAAVEATPTTAVQAEPFKKKKLLALSIPGWVLYGILCAVAAFLIVGLIYTYVEDLKEIEQAAQNGGTASFFGTALMVVIALASLIYMTVGALIPTGLGIGGLVLSLKKKLGKKNVVQFTLLTALPLATCLGMFFVAIVFWLLAGGQAA
jgi:hypothetical protein